MPPWTVVTQHTASVFMFRVILIMIGACHSQQLRLQPSLLLFPPTTAHITPMAGGRNSLVS